MVESERYLLEEARRLDPDRYLCALFAPPACRRALLALVLFNAELARIPDLVSQPMAGMIRFQWWREALEEAGLGRPRRHPVVEELAVAIGQGMLEERALQAVLDAREAVLEELAPHDLEELERHLEATAGSIGAQGARVLGAGPGLQEAAARAGLAYGMVGILRALGAELARGRPMLPETMLAAEGAALGAAPDSEAARGLRRVVERLLGRAETHLAKARAQSGRPPRALMAAFLPGRLARLQMARIRKAGGEPGRPPEGGAGGLVTLRLAAGWLARRY